MSVSQNLKHLLRHDVLDLPEVNPLLKTEPTWAHSNWELGSLKPKENLNWLTKCTEHVQEHLIQVQFRFEDIQL